MEDSEDRLRGFCSVTFDDCFVVRDLKIIEGNNGPFVAMPSRKLTSHCSKCRTKNHLRARFCNQCGEKQKSEDLSYDSDGRAKLYADIAHPVNARCREMIQNRVIEELEKEVELSDRPGYVSRYDDDYDLRNKQRRNSGGHRNRNPSNTEKTADRNQDPRDQGGDSKRMEIEAQSPDENPRSESTRDEPPRDETTRTESTADSKPDENKPDERPRVDSGSEILRPPHSGADRPVPAESPASYTDQSSQIPDKSSPERPPQQPPENRSNSGAGNSSDQLGSFPGEFGKGVFD